MFFIILLLSWVKMKQKWPFTLKSQHLPHIWCFGYHHAANRGTDWWRIISDYGKWAGETETDRDQREITDLTNTSWDIDADHSTTGRWDDVGISGGGMQILKAAQNCSEVIYYTIIQEVVGLVLMWECMCYMWGHQLLLNPHISRWALFSGLNGLSMHFTLLITVVQHFSLRI